MNYTTTSGEFIKYFIPIFKSDNNEANEVANAVANEVANEVAI